MRNISQEQMDILKKKLSVQLITQRKVISTLGNLTPKIIVPKTAMPRMIVAKSVMPLLQSRKIEIPKFVTPKLITATYKIPQIVMPKITFPRLKIDYERIETITNDNSNYGWTLTREISIFEYLNDDLLNTALEEKDEYFYNYYSKNDWQHYYLMKESLLESVDAKWLDLMNDCFDSFEQNKYKMVIPILFSIIEGESAFIYQTDMLGGRLIQFMKSQVSTEQDKFTKIAIYSLTNCMKK